jgi:hypothetical protein
VDATYITTDNTIQISNIEGIFSNKTFANPDAFGGYLSGLVYPAMDLSKQFRRGVRK